jgi:hypothetical protein
MDSTGASEQDLAVVGDDTLHAAAFPGADPASRSFPLVAFPAHGLLGKARPFAEFPVYGFPYDEDPNFVYPDDVVLEDPFPVPSLLTMIFRRTRVPRPCLPMSCSPVAVPPMPVRRG